MLIEPSKRYRIDIATASLMRCDPEFADTRAAAFERRKVLLSDGYRATVFKRTANGGLEIAR